MDKGWGFRGMMMSWMDNAWKVWSLKCGGVWKRKKRELRSLQKGALEVKRGSEV